MAEKTFAPTLPSIQPKSFRPIECGLTSLPFIKDIKTSPRRTTRKFWHTPEVNDYGAANIIGAQYAADLIQYLKQNPGTCAVSLMGQMAKEMYQPAKKEDKSHGIAAGFWFVVEKALLSGANNHYSIADSLASSIRYSSSEED